MWCGVPSPLPARSNNCLLSRSCAIIAVEQEVGASRPDYCVCVEDIDVGRCVCVCNSVYVSVVMRL